MTLTTCYSSFVTAVHIQNAQSCTNLADTAGTQYTLCFLSICIIEVDKLPL